MKENKLLRTTCSASLTLDEFIFHQLKLLEDFESSWRELHLNDEKTYPLEMFAGDWLEQLEFWREHARFVLAERYIADSADTLF